MKNKKRALRVWLFIVTGAAAIVLMGAVILPAFRGDDQPTEQLQTQTEIESEAEVETITYTAEAEQTVLEQLERVANVETEDSEYGVFVTSVNGVQGGGDTYWSYYVDGALATRGAGEYITEGGETIEWKFE